VKIRRVVKIAFIVDSLRRHGAQRFLTYLVRGLHDLGYTQHVVALNKVRDSDIERALSSAACDVTFIGKSALLLAGAGWWRLVAILKRSKPDVVMTMLDFADTLGRPAARLAGCRVLVSSIQVRNLTKPFWRRWLDRKTVSWADKIIFNSNEIVDYAREMEGVEEDQVVVIPNGVEDLLARSGALRNGCRNELKIGAETVLLGVVGRLYPQKNLSLLLRSAAKLSSARPWKILVVGDGPERRRLLALTRDLGLTKRVIWLGSREEVGGWLAAMDIFVHTADFEGMPNAVMEAMAMGLPVVASNVDGNRELIRNGVTGYLVAPGDASGFSEQIEQLIDNPNRGREVGEKAHREILERFSMARMIRSYDQLFISLGNRQSA
jgi:glycosyltransferase involved in cell wall biosynthesis